MKYYLKLLSVPLLFFLLYTSLFLAWRLFNLPPAEELVLIVENWFDKYGFVALFLSSILEGLLLIGGYFPGVFVIFLGVLVAGSPLEAAGAVFIATVGLIIAHIINYFLGKYGWYRLLTKFGMKDALEQSKKKLEKWGLIAIPMSYWLPSIGALTNTAAGIIHLPFKSFLKYSIFSSIFWYSLVGFIVYMVGEPALTVVVGGTTGIVIVYSIILVWILILLSLDYLEKRKQKIGLEQKHYDSQP